MDAWLHKGAAPVAVFGLDEGHVPGVEVAACRRHRKTELVAGELGNIQLHLRPAVIDVRRIGYESVVHAVAVDDQPVLENAVIDGGVERGLRHNVVAVVHRKDREGERESGCSHHGDAGTDGGVGEGELRVDGVLLGESVHDMILFIAVVARAGHEDHPKVGEPLHLFRQGAGAVHVVQPIEPPAHADDQAFALLLRHIVHPPPGVDDLLVAEAHADKEELGIDSHASVLGARATAAGDARAVGAVVGVVINVAGVAVDGQERILTDIFRAVVVACRRGTGGLELVPGTQHAVMGHRGVVKDGVCVVEAPVGDADDHALPSELLRQIPGHADTVHAPVNRGAMQQGLRAASQRQCHQNRK